jgi:glycosyltransferase involved in cell wall biosynthesis
MNILIVHNRYREPGGEDRVVDLESALLTRHGHRVVHYVEDNARIQRMAAPVVALRAIWSCEGYGHVRALIRQERIDLLHVHNTLPLVSPAVYYAARAAGVPVVQTLHNYRLLCPNALCFRGDDPCVECVTRRAAIPAVRHGCYRRSRAATATIAAMLWVHKAAGTWQKGVDAFIAPSEFARSMFVGGGLDADRIIVKPHFVDPDPGPGSGRGGYAVFVGRLSKEKGVDVLLDAWRRLQGRMPLVVVGDGPLAAKVAAAEADIPGLRWLGRRHPSDVQRLVADASILIFPSLAYETFGQVIGEAYAPARLCSRHLSERAPSSSRSAEQGCLHVQATRRILQHRLNGCGRGRNSWLICASPRARCMNRASLPT